MKKQLLFTLLLLVGLMNLKASAQCATTDQCNYQFVMSDTWGDGWNGNTMNVIQNGTVVMVLTGPTSAQGETPVSVSVPLCNSQPFELFWNPGGSYPSEVRVSVINPFEQTLYSMPSTGATQNSLLYSGNVNCDTPVCISPTGISSSIIDGTSADFNWSWSGGTAQWEVIIALASDPAPTSTSSGVVTDNPSYTATDLIAGTPYKFYVRRICSSGPSDWSAGHQFSPFCFAPSFLTAQALTSSEPILGWNANGSATEWEIIVLPSADPAPTASSTGVITSSNPYSAPGLVTGVPYKFYVRSVCGPGDVSAYTMSQPFSLFESLPALATNTSQFTPSELISTILVNNPCLAITNVTSSTGTNFGSVNGIGYFTNTNPNFPLSNGIILSTGNALSAPGPNTSIVSEGTNNWVGDPELESIISAATGQPMVSFNATKLEFDFTSLNEFMSFNFLFASDEYGTFQCQFADSFAFLLTDLTTGITTNLAVVPGTTTPVSVVTIRDMANNSACPSVNEGFFDEYFEGATNYLSATNFNGQTALMTASSVIIPGNPYHIKMVIADRQDTAYDSAVFIQAGSFSSGPPACSDKIELISFIDQNANGIKDGAEINFPMGTFTSELNNSGIVNNISSPLGMYLIYDADPANTYDFGYQINPEFAPFYTATATNYNDINIPTNSGTQILYFPVTLTQPYSDVAVTVVPVTPPVAGMNFVNRIEFRNYGVSPASGTLSFTKDPNVTIVNVSPGGTTNTAAGFTHSFTNLQPNELRFFTVTMSVPAIPVVNIDDILSSSANVDAGEGDLFFNNNTFTNSQVVVASYDPNDKMEAHGGQIPINQFSQQDYLYYTIRFQNTGTSNAVSVRLEDTLDAMLDEESIRVVSASHNYVMQRVNNQVTWNFDYIQLPPMLQDEELSKGYVTFKIQLKPGFNVGDIIPNGAEIYFDSNPAIVTNVFETEFTAALSTQSFTSNDVAIYPNPAHNTLYVQMRSADLIASIKIYDVVGKSILDTKHSSSQATIDVSSLSKGVYMVEITTQNNLRQVQKLIIN